jgi:hypothetical protein
MAKTAFDPQVNGFAFTNAFALSDEERTRLLTAVAITIDSALGMLGPFGLAARLTGTRDKLAQLLVSALPDRYGLCGGMAFAALDYFRARAPTPQGTGPDDQPPVGSALRMYLWRRLLDSWALNGATFLEWIARLHILPMRWPFDAGPRALRDRSRVAWLALQQHVDAGDPIPLGLVGDARDPFLDHQVLCYGYERRSELAGTIYVYDMNCPGRAQTIEIDLSAEVLVATESCPRKDNALRGFFCEAYAAQLPPG